MAIEAEGNGHYTADISQSILSILYKVMELFLPVQAAVMIVLRSDFQTVVQNHVWYSPRDKLKPVPSHRVSCIFEMLQHFVSSSI